MSFAMMDSDTTEKQFKVIKPCIDQDTKRRLKPGEFYTFESDFEKGRHLAEGNIVPVGTKIERAVAAPTETRKRRTRKKRNELETHNGVNGK